MKNPSTYLTTKNVQKNMLRKTEAAEKLPNTGDQHIARLVYFEATTRVILSRNQPDSRHMCVGAFPWYEGAFSLLRMQKEIKCITDTHPCKWSPQLATNVPHVMSFIRANGGVCISFLYFFDSLL